MTPMPRPHGRARGGAGPAMEASPSRELLDKPDVLQDTGHARAFIFQERGEVFARHIGVFPALRLQGLLPGVALMQLVEASDPFLLRFLRHARRAEDAAPVAKRHVDD